MFTPRDVLSKEAIQNDRPYASLLFTTNARMRVEPDNRTAWSSSFTIGALGLAATEAIHDTVHSVVGSESPQGYDHQISAGGEPTARYTLARHYLVVADPTGTMDVKATVQGSVGYLTETSAAITMRFGRFDTPVVDVRAELTDYIAAPVPIDARQTRPEVYMHAGVRVKARAYNAFLQGQFRHSDVTYSFDELEPVLAEAWVGFVTQLFEQTQVSYTLNYQTAEIRKGPAARDYFWGAVQLSHQFLIVAVSPRTPVWPASGGPFFWRDRCDRKKAKKRTHKVEQSKRPRCPETCFCSFCGHSGLVSFARHVPWTSSLDRSYPVRSFLFLFLRLLQSRSNIGSDTPFNPGVLRAEFLRLARAFVRIAGAGGLPGRDQLVLAVADQVGAAHALQRFAQQRPVVRRRGSAGTPCAGGALQALAHDVHRLAVARDLAQRVLARVVHRRRASPSGEGRRSAPGRRGSRCFLSHSARFIMSSSVVPGCAAMKYGIRYCSLPASFEYFSNISLKLVVAADARLHHLRQRALADVLGRDLQVAADVVLHQFLHVLGRFAPPGRSARPSRSGPS